MRLVEIILEEKDLDSLKDFLKANEIQEYWVDNKENEGICSVGFISRKEELAELLEQLDQSISFKRTNIIPVEATLPRLEDKSEPVAESEKSIFKVGKFKSVSKEELYEDIEEPVGLSFNFLFLVILSSIVAGIGILQENQAIIIGAMVIAPFLGPNVSLAFGTTLGDLKIIRKSLVTGITASLIAILISFVWGLIDQNVQVIEHQVSITYQDLLLALICGFAGVISILSGKGSTLVGVMVAAALLPPLMKAGLFLGGGLYQSGIAAFLIFASNIICLNLAGIITFYISGIRPHRWWEKEKASKKTRNAIIIWLSILIALALLIHFFNRV